MTNAESVTILLRVLDCIVCGKSLESAMPTDANVPHRGLIFRALGNYGSEVFDPGTGEQLEVNICDGCIKKHKDQVLLVKTRRVINTDVLSQWDGTYG